MESKYVEDYIFDAEKEYKNDHLLNAINILKSTEDMILSGEVTFNDASLNKNAYNNFVNNKFVKTLYKDNDFIFQCLDNYKQINKRDPDRSSDGIDNWFMKLDNSNTITISGRVTISCNFFHMVAVFKETDLLQSTIGSFEELKTIEKLSETRWLVRSRIKVPILTNRELYLLGFGIFLEKEKMIMLPFYTPDKDDFSSDLIPDKSDYTRVNMKFGYYCVRYLDDNNSELFSCFNVDPNISMVPWFVVNGFIKEFGYYIMRDFKKAAEDVKLKEEYLKRIKENSKFYDLIKEHLKLN